jgi:hypothetical protein
VEALNLTCSNYREEYRVTSKATTPKIWLLLFANGLAIDDSKIASFLAFLAGFFFHGNSAKVDQFHWLAFFGSKARKLISDQSPLVRK